MTQSFTTHDSSFAKDGRKLWNPLVRCEKRKAMICFPGHWRVKQWWKSRRYGTYRIDLEEISRTKH